MPDAVTRAACRWLLDGAVPGTYAGPLPAPEHALAPLLSGETGRGDIRLTSELLWYRQERIIRPVLERIALRELRIWAFKGFDLARSVYPVPGGRPMGDADLFLEPGTRQAILRAFHEEGWSRGSTGDGEFSSGIVSEMKMHRRGILVELHTHVFYFPATFPGRLPPDLFAGGRPLGAGLMGFDWHHALLLVLLHLLTNRVTRPAWWTDVCLLGGKVGEAGSWGAFVRDAGMTRLGHAMSHPLRTASEELGAPVPRRVIEALQRQDASREGVLEQLLGRPKIPTLLNLRYLTGWRRISWSCALLSRLLDRRASLPPGAG